MLNYLILIMRQLNQKCNYLTTFQYILIVLTLFSCTQKTKESKPIILSVADAVDAIQDLSSNLTISFNKILEELRAKAFPLIDSTSFNNFNNNNNNNNFYNKEEIKTLQLEKIYSSFEEGDSNFKATASYKVNFSKNFNSIVITILLGDNTMESVLINYDLNGDMIDYEVISYDEIVDDWFKSKIESKMESNIITVNHINWSNDDKHEESTFFKIEENGKIEHLSQEEIHIESVIQQLNLDKFKIKKNLIVAKVQPNNSDETIVVIPEIAGTDNGYDFELNSHIVLINSNTGKITHRYYESSYSSEWASDAVVLSEIKIDTAPYIVSKETRAFGIRIYRLNMSKANPYSNEHISLFVKSGDSLKKVLHNYDVMISGGEWDTNCYGEFVKEEKLLVISDNMTNGYFDILVKNKITDTKADIDENGDCEAKDIITTQKTLLKFNGEKYN
ncbi:MAG: hypothetical protein COA67_03905 [Lutibacter sp.]|nr:MAG: hypothetical protein COA67_03905 [Lutibacter sp.]